jgi:tetratricopeptide (TPR) repeat protein
MRQKVVSAIVVAGSAAVGASLFAPPLLAQESALDTLRAAARSDAGNAEASLALGRALRRAGRDVEAIQELRRGANQPSGRSGDVAIKLRWETARTYVERREFSQAMAACRTVGALPRGQSAGHACAAETHLLWKRASEALLETSQALANGAQSYEAKVAEGLACELEVKEAEAEASFRQAIAWKGNAPEAHIWLGRLLLRELKHDEGISELRKAVELDPSDPQANYELALTLPPNAESEALLRKAVHDRPTYALALLKLANVEIALNNVAGARAAVDGVMKYDPHEPGSHVIAGRVALLEGHPDDAIREGQAALGLLANSASAKLVIADAYAQKNEIDLAVENYQAAYGFDHTDPTSLVRASEACLAQGRSTSARAFGEKATKEFPAWSPAWVAYGDALAGEKETALARTAYQTALRTTGPLDMVAVQRKLNALR